MPATPVMALSANRIAVKTTPGSPPATPGAAFGNVLRAAHDAVSAAAAAPLNNTGAGLAPPEPSITQATILGVKQNPAALPKGVAGRTDAPPLANGAAPSEKPVPARKEAGGTAAPDSSGATQDAADTVATAAAAPTPASVAAAASVAAGTVPISVDPQPARSRPVAEASPSGAAPAKPSKRTSSRPLVPTGQMPAGDASAASAPVKPESAISSLPDGQTPAPDTAGGPAAAKSRSNPNSLLTGQTPPLATPHEAKPGSNVSPAPVGQISTGQIPSTDANGPTVAAKPGLSAHPTPVGQTAGPSTGGQPGVAKPAPNKPLPLSQPASPAATDPPVSAAPGPDGKIALRPTEASTDATAQPAATPAPLPQALPVFMPPNAPVPVSVTAPPDVHSAGPTPAAEQIAPALLTLAKTTDGSQLMTVRLHPADLGMVQVRIAHAASGETRIEITAEKADTLLTLERDQPQLHHTLDQAGIPAAARIVTFHIAQPAQTSASGDGSGSPASQPGFANRGTFGNAGAGGSPGGGSGDGGSGLAARGAGNYYRRRRSGGTTEIMDLDAATAAKSYRIGLDITA